MANLQRCLFGLQAVVVWLAAQPQVHWVSPRPKTRAANFFATGIGQSGNAAAFAAASNGPGPAGDAGTHPLWDAGLYITPPSALAQPHDACICVLHHLPI